MKMLAYRTERLEMKAKFLLCFALVLSGVCDAAIVYPKPLDGGQPIVIENAKRVLKSDPKFLGGFRFDELTVADPYRVYGVSAKDLAAGKLVSAAGPGGWQYPLMHGSNVVGMEEVIANEKTGGVLRFNGLYESNFSIEMAAALQMAGQLPQVKMQDYEVRRLDCAPILFVSLWLHGKTDDIIIPLGATFGRWNANQPYSEREILKLLKSEAKKKLKEPPRMLD